MRLLFIRHGETQWNRQKRFQGHTDTQLSEDGVRQVGCWKIPDHIEHWYVSPLYRARQTAQIHQLGPIEICEKLIEAFWGDWEGKVLKELRKADPQAIADIESKGLDMRPPGGESPREVRSRLVEWLHSIPLAHKKVGVVTHRGVIRAALSQATGWDMQSTHRVNITHNKAYEFSWEKSKLDYICEHDLL